MKYQPPYGSPGPDDPYVNGDPSIARQGSILPASAAEYPQREIVNLIESSDQIPSDGDLEQLTRGVRNQWVNFCIDHGPANALSVALTPALQAYKQGLPLRVLVSQNNTGTSTINVNALGNRPIKRSNGAQLVAGDLRAGMIALLVDDGTSYQLVNYLGAVGGITNNYTIDIPYAQDTSPTQNQIIANYTPSITTVVAGDVVLVRVAKTNTGPVVININGLGNQPVRRNDAQPLQSYDLLADECILIEYNTTYWQMLRLVRSQVYFKLSADLILYVRPTGNDTTGDGSVNDDAHAFQSIQRAVDFVRSNFLIAGRTVTIRLGAIGTYGPAGVIVSDLPGSIVIEGDIANPVNYNILGATNAPVVRVRGSGTSVTMRGVTFSANTTQYFMVETLYNSFLFMNDCIFSGVATNYAAVYVGGGMVQMSGGFHIYNPVSSFFEVVDGSVHIGMWNTVINSHTITYSRAFVLAYNSYVEITAGWCVFAGTAYGQRYAGLYNSVILTGGGANYLPGNIPGQVDDSSVYT